MNRARSRCAARPIPTAMRAAAPRSMIWRMIRPRPTLSPANSRVHFISDTPPPLRWRGWKRSSATPAAISKAHGGRRGGRSGRLDARSRQNARPSGFCHRHLPAAGLAQGAERRSARPRRAMQACRMMGHFPMAAPSPKGWSDQSGGLVRAPTPSCPASLSPGNWRARLPPEFRAARRSPSWPTKRLGQRLSAATRSARLPPPPMPATLWRFCCPAPNSNGDRSHGISTPRAATLLKGLGATAALLPVGCAAASSPSPRCRATGVWWS